MGYDPPLPEDQGHDSETDHCCGIKFTSFPYLHKKIESKKIFSRVEICGFSFEYLTGEGICQTTN